MSTTAFDDQFRTEGEAHVRVAELEAELARMRSLSSVYTRIEQLEEENRTVAAHAADLEHKIKRIEARAMNGWACSQVANEECEAIAKIIKDDEDEADLERAMMTMPSIAIMAIDGANLAIEDVSEGGDPD